MAKRLLKVSSIKLGDIEEDGGMGTVLAALGTTYQGTCQFSKPAPSVKDEYSEESDDPEELILSNGGMTTVKWGITDWTPATIVKIFGGAVDSTTDPANPKWSEPDVAPRIEQSLEIISQSGVKITMPRVMITAGVDDSIGKDKSTVITITATKMKPTKAGEKAMYVV